VLQLLRTPRWIGLTVAALLLVAAFGALSYWQWQRAQRDRVEAAPVPVSTVLPTAAPLDIAAYGTRVEASGRYDASRQVLVAHGPSSFWVVTPLVVADGAALPVARGTVASPEDPAVAAVPAGTVHIVGVAQPFEGDPGGASALPAGQVPRVTASAFPGDPVAGGWVALETQDPAGPAMAPVVAPIAVSTTANVRLQNASYAVQWILFAGFVAFFWVRMLRYDLAGATPASTPDGVAPVREVY
jgi:cytochrome oxidase assembly protein ShyY1